MPSRIIIRQKRPDVTKPTTPALSGSLTSTLTTTLSWTASSDPTVSSRETVSGLYGYRVYRNGAQVVRQTGTSYVDTLPNTGVYQYTVRAEDNAGNLSYASNTVTIVAASTTEDWQLASGHYVPAKMAPVIIHPRPDGETNTWERHRLAPAGIAWRIPIAVQGGSWPFRYTVDATSAAKGITIGRTYGEADYGVLSWTNPTLGSHTITVTVETQETGRNTSGFSDPSPVTFTLEVAAQNDSRFAFLNGGTLASVLGSASAARQLFLRAGTYTTDGAAQFELDGSRPSVIVGYPGEAVTISYTQRNFAIRTSGCYLGGFQVADGGYGGTVANVKYFNVNLIRDRITMFDVHFDSVSNGTSGTDVATGLSTSGGAGTTTYRKYVSVVNCSESGRPTTSNAYGLFCFYCVENFVVEGNDVEGQGVVNMYLKSSCRNGSVRNNHSITTAGEALSIGGQVESASVVNANIEFCFNRAQGQSLLGGTLGQTGEYWFYRNSLYRPSGGGASQPAVRIPRANDAGNGPFLVDRNAILWTYGNAAVSTGTQVTVSNTECHGTSGILDATTLNLVPPFTTYQGTRGAQVN